MSDQNTVLSSESEEREPEARDAGSTRSSAHDLGDVTGAERVQNHEARVGVDGDEVDYYRFTLTQAREMRLGLGHLEGDAELYLEDAEGTVLGRSVEYRPAAEAVVRTLGPGTYYVRVEAQGAQASEHLLKVRAQEPYEAYAYKGGALATLLGLPSFGEWSQELSLSENAPGSVTPVSLGTASATDPDGDALRYTLVGGHESGLFTIDASSGEVFYAGSGEDFESVTGPYELTVRASDGTHTIDATVTVSVTDEAEAPVFAESSYEFFLAENVDGDGTRISLGTVSATDPDGGDTLRYTLVGGNESGLFTIDASSGELFYIGSGEDHESVPSHALTVRASDGTSTTDTTVTVTVTDAPEAPSFAQSSYGFFLAENTDGSVTRVSLGTVQATDPEGATVGYSLAGGNESGRFTIDASSGELFYIGTGEDHESVPTHALTVRASDGTRTKDTAVTVAVTDVRGDSEAPGEDLPQDRTTGAVVLVDEGPVRGNIESTTDWDWFAVDLQGGRT